MKAAFKLEIIILHYPVREQDLRGDWPPFHLHHGPARLKKKKKNINTFPNNARALLSNTIILLSCIHYIELYLHRFLLGFDIFTDYQIIIGK